MRVLSLACLLAVSPAALGEMLIDDFDQASMTGTFTTTTSQPLNDDFAGTVTTFTTGGPGSSVVTGGGGVTTTLGSPVHTANIEYDFDVGSALDILTTSQTALRFDLFEVVAGTVNYILTIDDDADGSSAPAVFTGSVSAGDIIQVTRADLSADLAGDIDTISLAFSTPDLGGALFSATTSPEVLTVPEPSTYVLFGLTGLGLVWYLRRRQTAVEAC